MVVQSGYGASAKDKRHSGSNMGPPPLYQGNTPRPNRTTAGGRGTRGATGSGTVRKKTRKHRPGSSRTQTPGLGSYI